MVSAVMDLEQQLAALEATGSPPPEAAARSLLAAVEARLAAGPLPASERESWWGFLDATGRSGFLRALGDDAARRRWAEAAFRVIEETRFTLGDLFEQRVREAPERLLFQHADGAHGTDWSYQRAARHLRVLAATLLGPTAAEAGTSPRPARPGPRVALFGENAVAIAAADLACLHHDIFVTPLSVHTDADTLAWILERLAIDTVITDSEERLLKVRRARQGVGRPVRVFVTDSALADAARDVEDLEAEAAGLTPRQVESRLAARARFGMRDVCTVMFTSGSTGRPKGVAFTQLNLVSKRFARAAALPDVGGDERFLCYLPLFHTFGRYLELLGAIYWRGTYVFAGNPSTETLLRQLPEVRPTGLISIPLRWAQIHERCLQAFGTTTSATEQQALFEEVTGGRLRWGLSAAGYLEPRVFRFFHRHGVRLSSGFGMTEGTGGLTMTPPDDYIDDSVGVPLPGTSIRFGEAGELEIAGPYIARYLPETAASGDLAVAAPDSDEHWLPTGDLFCEIERGHLRIVDRVKDIYKNNRGQTVAPRKVESAFTGVPGIRRTFLVGDGRAWNTLLIVPDRDDALGSLSPEEQRDYFQRLITQANLDLAPYERVVNFALLERDFSEDHGELTPKGSYQRKRIEANFRDVIDELYGRVPTLQWQDVTIQLPRWFHRDLGLLEGAIRVVDDGLLEPASGRRLTLARGAVPGRLRVGDLEYTLEGRVLDLGAFVRQPLHWLGNPELMAFGPCKVGWDTALAAAERVRLPDRPPGRERPPQPVGCPAELQDVDVLCQRALYGPEADALLAVDALAALLEGAGHRLSRVIRRRLEALSNHPADAVRCQAYQVLVLDNPVLDYSGFFPAFVESGRSFLCPRSIAAIASTVEPRRLHALRRRMHAYRDQLQWPADEGRRRVFNDLFQLLADFARFRPEFYGTVREELVAWVLHDGDAELARLAEQHFHALADWFEAELRARYPEHEDAAAWDGKIEFQEGLGEREKARILGVLAGTTFLQQSLLLTHDGETVELEEIDAGGIWVSRIRSHPAYTRYRLSINTLEGRHFDLQVVLPEDPHAETVLPTIFWNIALRGYPQGRPVLPPFGCYRPELGAFSVGYVSDLTVWEKIREHSSARDDATPAPWRRLMATAMAAVFRGWLASGRRIVPGLVGPTNVVVPEPDFREDALLINLMDWREYHGPVSLVRPLVKNFFRQTSAHYPRVRGELRLTWIFDAVREALPPGEARLFLHQLREELEDDPLPEAGPGFADRLDEYLFSLDEHYLPPLAVEGALARYAEWAGMSGEATAGARLGYLEELFRLYRLERFGEIARYHVFRHAYFADAAPPVRELLDRIIAALHREPQQRAAELVELSDLQDSLEDDVDHAAFQRLAFPHFRPHEDVEVLTVGDRDRQHVILRTHVTDRRGAGYIVHDPTGPAEMGEVYRMFFRSGYPKTVSERDRFLVVRNDREQVVGGVCYHVEGGGVVHMDGIVVARALHDRGVTSAILEDFATRLADAGHRLIKTHYFLPGYYQKRGFRIDRRWGGLVRFLAPEGQV